jgi:hypothetical protein
MKKGKSEAGKYPNQTKKECEDNDKDEDKVKGSAAIARNLVSLPKDAGILEV